MVPSDFLLVASPFVLIGISTSVVWYLLFQAAMRNIAHNEERRDKQRQDDLRAIVAVVQNVRWLPETDPQIDLHPRKKVLGGNPNPGESERPSKPEHVEAAKQGVKGGTKSNADGGETSMIETMASVVSAAENVRLKDIYAAIQSLSALLLRLVGGQAQEQIDKQARAIIGGNNIEEPADER